MKAKMSFNSDALKQGLIAHGEKIGMAIFLLIAGMLLWGAWSVTGYEPKPEDLVKKVRSGRDKLNNSHKSPDYDIAKDGIKLPEPGNSFSDVIDRELLKPMNASQYAGIAMNRPIVETKERRREPVFLALRDLKTTFSHSAVNFKSGDNKHAPQGEEWITVTGLVPFDEQAAAYAKAFDRAIDPQTNAIPVYDRYEIRRAEVSSLDPGEAVDWDKIQPLSLREYIFDWMGKFHESGAEQAHADAVYWPPLTEPLPPVTDKNFSGWSVHPTMLAPAANVPAPAAAPAHAPPAPAAPKFDDFGRPIAAPAAPPANAPAANGQAPAVVNAAAPAKRMLLFRFFDFNIEAGKTYRYQVKLILKNPNFNLDLAHIEKPELRQGETRETTWSEASAPIRVPYLDRYYANDVVKLLSGDAEPIQTSTIRWWFPPLGAEGLVAFEGRTRGALLNASEATVKYLSPGANELLESKQAFTSNSILLDFSWERSDDKLRGPSDRPAAVNRPGETLIVNARGDILIRSQLLDWELGAGDQISAIMGEAKAAPAADQPADAADPAKPAQPADADPGKAKLRFDLNN